MYGRVIQTLAVLLTASGIILMLWSHAEAWTILTAGGGLLFAIGTKIVYFGFYAGEGRERRPWNGKERRK